MAANKLIKRYANRKLYDTHRSCYVTLDDIASMIRTGDEVQVIDNKSGEDLTSVTLAQIIFETEKKNSFMPLELLRELIQNGGDTLGGMADRAHEIRQEMRDQAAKLRSSMGDQIDKVRHSAEVLGSREAQEGSAPRLVGIGDILGQPRQAMEDLRRHVDESLRILRRAPRSSTVSHVGRDLDEIQRRLGLLEDRLEALSQRAA